MSHRMFTHVCCDNALTLKHRGKLLKHLNEINNFAFKMLLLTNKLAVLVFEN